MILLEALLAMRKILLEITSGYDVMLSACTIAGVAMRVFRKLFLPQDHLPIIPEHGYERMDKASDKAIRFLEWCAIK